MKLIFRNIETPKDQISENEIRIYSLQYEELTGHKASANRLKPWKGRVVRITTPSGSIHRLLKGNGNLPIQKDTCWMGPRTRSQLEICENLDVEISMVNQLLGRFIYYNSHLEDAVRFSFRIGLWGLILGLLSLLLSLISIFKPQ